VLLDGALVGGVVMLLAEVFDKVGARDGIDMAVKGGFPSEPYAYSEFSLRANWRDVGPPELGADTL